MRRIRILLILLLTAALITAGALLPRIMAWVQDSAIRMDGFSDIHSIELDLDSIQPSNESREPADMTSKLVLIQNMYTIPLSTTEASMLEETVYESVEKAMKEYIAAGIFEWFDVTYRSAEPFLGIDPKDTQNNNVFWSVTFTNEKPPYENLFLYVDDETGRIVYIRYEKYGSFSMDEVWERNLKLVDAFSELYFSPLGLTEAAEYAESIQAGTELWELDGGVTCMRYSFGDILSGELNIDLYACGDGSFYTYFPGL